jgi:tetratricopeptide (TPR) repeat protein
MGAAYFKAQNFDVAEDSLNEAINLGIENRFPQVRLMLANVCVQQERWEDAIDQLDKYLRRNPFGRDRGKIKDMREEIKENLGPTEE